MIFSLNLARVVARVKGIVSLWRDSANAIPTHIGLSEPLQMMWPALKLLVDHIQPQRKQTNLIVGLYKSVWLTWPCMGPGNSRC